MPFRSKAQQRWMFANHPAMAKRWAAVTPDIKDLPQHVGKEKSMSAFDQLAAKLSKRPGVNNPRALAASIGRKKYGASTMAQASARRESVQAVLRRRRKK